MFLKFLLTVAIVTIIWLGFRLLAQQSKDKRPEPPPRFSARRDPSDLGDGRSQGEGVTEMVRCRVCDAFQAGGRNCGRKDCPY